eukprot:14713758-Ditylum_brightwellii.AAC.1
MAPPGTKCYIHIKLHKQASWGFHMEDAWYVRPALQHYRCYTVVMKKKAAQRITDTIKFKHHGAKVPTFTLAERVAKAAVLLKEQQPTRDEPTRSGATYTTPQQQLVTTKEQIPTNPIPSCHPALILCDLVEIEQPAIEEAPIIPIVAPRRYNLREKATHIINFVILEESPNVQNALGKPKHIGKYTEALRHMLVTEAHKEDMHVPTGMFIGSIIDPETGCQLQYEYLIQQKKCRDVWIKAFTKELDQLSQGKCRYKGTNTVGFIKKDEMPKGRSATYGRLCVTIDPKRQIQTKHA